MERVEALYALVSLRLPVRDAVADLSAFSWDSEFPLVMVGAKHFEHVLSLFKTKSLSASEIEIWANAIECRDDVGFQKSKEEVVRPLLHELANPLLTEQLTNERAEYWLAELRRS